LKQFVITLSLVILCSACTPSEDAIQTAMAQTQEAAPNNTPTSIPPTHTPMPTHTPFPTQTVLPTATLEPLPIAGIWKGKTTGTNNGNPISERIVTVSIPVDCQLGLTCAFAISEGACNYEMTPIDIQDAIYTFDFLTVSGADFCSGNSSNQYVELTLLSEYKLDYYYRVTRDDGTVVIRKGVLTLQQ